MTKHIIEPEALDSVLHRAFVHAHENGTVCANCGAGVRVNQSLKACTECGHHLSAVVVDGGMDTQLQGRPTYFLERPTVTGQAIAN